MSPTPSNRSGASGSSTHTGGQGTSNGTMLSVWASSQNPTEAFYTTGAKTGRGAMKGAGTVVAFEKAFNKTS
ncbi:hypothetical protein ACJ41O_014079 [Fusarium nematophilum]